MPAPKLLLVEDDPALAELLEFRFKSEGYQVTATADGDEALLLAVEQLPDLVVLDWMIEGTSGIEVCRRLRRDKATAHVPIVMLTARGAEDDRIRGLETGADDYVTKPFSPRELVARVNAIMRRIRPALAGDLQLVLAPHERPGRSVRHPAPVSHGEWVQRLVGWTSFGRALNREPSQHRGSFAGAPGDDGFPA